MEKLLKKSNKANSRIQNKENSILGIKRPKFKSTAPRLSRSLNNVTLGLKTSSVVKNQNISIFKNREPLIPMETNVAPSPPSIQSSSPKVVTSSTSNFVLPVKETSRIIPSKQLSNNSGHFLKPSSSYVRKPLSSSAANVSRSLFKEKSSMSIKNQMQRETSFSRPKYASQLDISRSSRATQRMPIYVNGFMPPMNAFNCTSSASSVMGCMPGLNMTNSMFKFPGYAMSQVSFERSSNVQRVQELLSLKQEKKFKEVLKFFICSKDVDDLHKMFFMEKLVMRIKQANGLCEAQRQFMCQEPTMNFPLQDPMVSHLPVTCSLTPEQKMEEVASWINTNVQEAEAEAEFSIEAEAEAEAPLSADELDNVSAQMDAEEEEEQEVDQLEENISHDSSIKLCGTYALRDWTLVLGDGPTDLKVSGTVVHILMRTVVQENHVSDLITEVVNNTTVKTQSCSYILNGRIEDPKNLIPETIKASFKKIGFPKNWQDICRRWHAIIHGGSPSNGRSNPHAPINNTTPRRQRRKKDLCTPVRRNVNLDNTIITRSVSKKLNLKRLGAFGFFRN